MWKQIRKIITRFRPGFRVRDRIRIQDLIAIEFSSLTKTARHAARYLAGWCSHQRPPSPNSRSSDCSTFHLSELIRCVTKCGYLLTWLRCNRPLPKRRMNSFHRDSQTELFLQGYLFSIAFPHYLCIQIKWTCKTTCNNAELIMYQISPKSRDQ